MTSPRTNPSTRAGVTLPPKLPQVLPENVEAHGHHRQDDYLPEELVEKDESTHHRQADVDADQEPAKPLPETGFDEGKHGDGNDEYEEQVLSLVDEYSG